MFILQELFTEANVIDDEKFRWKDGVVPYTISKEFSKLYHSSFSTVFDFKLIAVSACGDTRFVLQE